MTDGGPPLNPKRSLIWKLVVTAAIFLLFLFVLSIDTNNVLLFSKYVVIKAVQNEDFAKEEIPLERHFRKRPEVAHVDCERLFQDDKEYMKQIAKNRPKIVINANLSMDCDAIKERILPARNPNTGFPILYARLVYKDYEFLEDQLATNYASENVFCYSIDKKALSDFKARIFALEKCLPNVVVAKIEHDMDSAGHNHNEAHLDCMKSARAKKWKYAMLLQNHDVMIKTHGEMTEILKIYGGANDVEIDKCPDSRCTQSLETNLKKLELCPKHLTGNELAKCESSILQWGKGMMQVLLSREAVDFIFDEINVMPLVKQFNKGVYGMDEILYNTLQINPEVRLPGGFHPKCLLQGKQSQFISRITIWSHLPPHICASGNVRHFICIYGVEHLPFLADSKYVMANKMMPDFDQAVTSCISEMLFNRTRDGPNIDRNFYANISSVRYHHQRNQPGFSIDEFKCEP